LLERVRRAVAGREDVARAADGPGVVDGEEAGAVVGQTVKRAARQQRACDDEVGRPVTVSEGELTAFEVHRRPATSQSDAALGEQLRDDRRDPRAEHLQGLALGSHDLEADVEFARSRPGGRHECKLVERQRPCDPSGDRKHQALAGGETLDDLADWIDRFRVEGRRSRDADGRSRADGDNQDVVCDGAPADKRDRLIARIDRCHAALNDLCRRGISKL
jgi:hypothetical protein